MSVTISLPPELERTLVDRARAAGMETPVYAAHLVERALKKARTLQEISGDVSERFLASGTTDEQLGEELERAKHQMRAAAQGEDL